jgi:ABC-type Fe3+-siderophore transport system permease subunit
MFRRALVVLTALLVTLAVAGCGDQTVTIKPSAASPIVLVASGDAAAIAFVKGASPGGSVTDGDSHSGNKICETDVSDSGHSYHVVLDSTAPLPSTSCDSFKSGING